MELTDALTITALGIGVVFFGLLLTNLMIRSFSIVSRLQAMLGRARNKEKSGGTPAKGGQSPDGGKTPVQSVKPEVLAVIATVLEVELRLQASLSEGKFTFKE